MAKITKYFANQEEYDAYWQGAQPGSKYLCIIQDSGVEGLENVLVTTSNNAPNSGGETQEMGASTIEIIYDQDDIIADYEDELNDAEEITNDIKGENTNISI